MAAVNDRTGIDGPGPGTYDPANVYTPTVAPASAPVTPASSAPLTEAQLEQQWLNIASQFGTGPSTQSNISGYAGGNAYRGNLQPVVDAYNAKYGAHAKVLGDDTVDFGDGRGPTDVITGAGNFWYSEPGGGDASLGRGGGAPAPSGGGGGGLGLSGLGDLSGFLQSLLTIPSANINTAPSTNIVGNTAGQTQSLLDTLKSKYGQSLSIDPTTDPIIRNQVDNYGASQQRNARNMINDMAESSNPYQTGAMTAAGVQANEKAGQATSDLQASLVANELQNRRAEIQNALSESGSLLSQQDQLALQDELGKINAQIQNRAVTNQLGLGLGQLALGQQNLNSSNDQFAANYGLNATNLANYWDSLRSGG